MPTDFAPKSALPTPILDRFRLLLKDISVSDTEDFVRIYEDVLSELTINSKPIITELTIIAGDFRGHAEGIAHCICSRILEVSVEQKLPSLYLLDSIVKNIGRDYIRHFASDLPEVFCEVYRQVPPNLHSSMRHLFGTWSTVFPSSVLRQIENELQLSPRLNQPSSTFANLRASESPRPSHGIHVNPDYLKARQFDNMSVKDFPRGVPGLQRPSPKESNGFEDYDYDQGENSDGQRFYSAGIGGRLSFQPAASGSGRPSSPSIDNFAVSNSPDRMFERDSPSHYGHRVRGRDEEIIDWQKRPRLGDFDHGREIVADFSLNNGFDRDGTRALIDAYGHDDGQRSLNKKPQVLHREIVNGAMTKFAENTWQSTEEEDFDWERMSPTLADGKSSNFNQSSIPSTRDFRGQTSVNSLLSRPFDHSSRSNMRNPEQMLSTEDSQKALEDSIQIQDGASNLPGIFPAPLQKRPVSGVEYTSQVNINGAPKDGNQFKPVHFPVSLRGPPRGPPVSTDLRPHTSFHGMTPLPPLYPQQRPSFTILNQVPKQFENGDSRNTFLINPAQRPQPVVVPLHYQPRPPVSLQQPLPLSTVSPALLRPGDLVYPKQGQMASGSNIRNNPMHAFQSSPFQNPPNSSMLFRGPVPQVPPGPRPYSHIPPLSQSTGPVGNLSPSVNISGLLNSGLFNSLQGLLPLMKQPSEQVSIGVEFDPDSLKVRHESAIRALYEDLPRQCTTCGLRFKTQDEHSKHMDWHVTKNRISKNRKHNPSRKWFVSASMWLSGTEALGVEATPGFLPNETVVETKDDEEMAVLADEDQTACALCGERFEDFYSDETEEWMYRGAVYLNTPSSGTTLGVDRSQLGPIVHAKCRSETTSAPC